MERILIILFLSLSCLLGGCEDDKSYYNESISACGVKNPQKNIKWLSELIEKAEKDKTLNYFGTIWLEKYKGNDIFVTDMMMGSGGIAYYFFDCEGNSFVPENFLEFANNMKKDIIIYTNLNTGK